MILFLIVFCLIALLQKPASHLACGLFGYAGFLPVDIMRINILGLYNDSRGGHSCGLSYDNEIIKGTGIDMKKWSGFAERVELPTTMDSQTVIGHTRYATLGSHTEANAHPFRINDRIIGAHNGTIDNIRALAHKYEVDVTGLEVDSQMLYKIIAERGFDVLNDYVGYAALLFKYIDEPDVLYMYHGASRTYVNGGLVVERPLFYYPVKGGIYISSMDSSLKAIQDKKYKIIEEEDEIEPIEPIQVPVNRVMRIDCTGDKMSFTTVFRANRDDNNITRTTYGANAGGHQNFTPPVNNNTNFRKADSLKSVTGAGDSNSGNKNSSKTPAASKTYLPKQQGERLFTPDDINAQITHVTWYLGRYTTKGTYMHGQFSVDVDGRILKPRTKHDKEFQTYHFYRGVMIKDHEVWNRLTRSQKLLKKLESDKFSRIISKYSKYPVKATPSDSDDADIQEIWYYDGKVIPYLSFAPIFSFYQYEVFAGTDTKEEKNEKSAYNKGSITNEVFLQYESDDDGFIDAYDLSLMDKTFDTFREIFIHVPKEQINMLVEYYQYVHMFGDSKIPQHKVANGVYYLLDKAVKEARTIREVIEREEELTFEEFIHLSTSDDEDEEPEAERDIIVVNRSQEEVIAELKAGTEAILALDKKKPVDLDAEFERMEEDYEDRGFTPEYLNDLTSDEELNKNTVAESCYNELIEDFVSELRGLTTVTNSLSRTEYQRATELSDILNRAIATVKNQAYLLLCEQGKVEQARDLNKLVELNDAF